MRTRSLPAVRAFDGGAGRQPTGGIGLHLAVQTTGRGGSGTPQAREQQAGIITLLLERGARVRIATGAAGQRQAATGESAEPASRSHAIANATSGQDALWIAVIAQPLAWLWQPSFVHAPARSAGPSA